MGKALIIPLLKPDKRKSYLIGKKVMDVVETNNQEGIVNSLAALATVVAALNRTLEIICTDLGENYGEKVFQIHLSRLKK